MTAMIQFAVSGRQYEFEKSRASQEIRKIVLGIKKAAPSREADTKNSQRNYNIVQIKQASEFEERKARLRKMLMGYRYSAAMEWDKLPAEGILRLVEQLKQYAKKRQNMFYLGAALYGLRVLRRLGKRPILPLIPSLSNCYTKYAGRV
ncbi:hypothetical protein M7775_17160 [Sporomusa sphaeroides DSM 2875]|uniref:hypothetical protein n=1 Tax=Sporomusa sphaeroides TaxID=47679 RepID=UPI00203071FA|nr:hypothetical protein [Sporomusa sphaeroides]MCM0760285.1 hypothetical protein [Sporomusa sphaeroides DSM 2875]